MAVLAFEPVVYLGTLPWFCLRCRASEWMRRIQNIRVYYRRNHHTMMKNQNTTTKNTMYQSHRHPCLDAMLFIRRNVPERKPDVSANASFYYSRA